MGNKTRSIFKFASDVVSKITPVILTGLGVLKDYWIQTSGAIIKPVVKDTVVKTIWLNYSTIVTFGSCIDSFSFFVFYCKHYLNLDKKFKEKTNETKTVKLEIFCPFDVGASIIMCKQDLQIKLGQTGTVVKKLSSKIAMVEFTVSSVEQHFIPDNFIKAAYQSYGEGIVLISDDY